MISTAHVHDLIRATSPGVEPVVAMCRACGDRFMRRDGEWVSIEMPRPVDPVEAAAYALAVHGPYRPHAVIGVLGDGSTGVLRLQFTEPATEAEVAHVVDVVSDYVPLPLYVETVWKPRSAP